MYIVYKLLILCKNKLLFIRIRGKLQSINKYLTLRTDIILWFLA